MALVIKEPYGVVVGMAPWNAALLLGLRAVCAPIACGNTCVYQPSPFPLPQLSPPHFDFYGLFLSDSFPEF
jgi:Aldehyde dehydrogenase family